MPHWLIDGMIYLGSLLMVYNIIGFVRYARYVRGQTKWGHRIVLLYIPIVLLVLFLLFRLILGFVLRLIDFGAAGLPRLRRFDALLSCGIGLLHGILLVFIVFMLVPLMLVVVPKLVKYIDDSVLGGFFYKANLLLKLVPTV